MYIITDCNGDQAGNKQGYKTMSAALAVANNRKTAVYKQITQAWQARPADDLLKSQYKNCSAFYRVEYVDNTPPLFTDAQALFDEFKSRGANAADDLYRRLIKARKLSACESKALSDKYFALVQQSKGA
jgi:hypothetical protein